MAQSTSCETELSSIGFYHLLSTESGIIGTTLWEMVQGMPFPSCVKKAVLHRKDSGMLFYMVCEEKGS